MPEPRSIYPKHFFQGPPVPRKRTGFILMPFKDEFMPVHEAIQAAIKDADLEPLRADDIFSTQAGMEKIMRGIAEAEVVVADMSERNANVFYEAGIAHMAKENVVLLTRDRGDFPFDLQHIDHIIYEPSDKGLRELTEKLSQVIRNLPIEPAFELQSASTVDLSVAEIRRDLRRLLRVCEQQWMDDIIPTQIEVFQKDFQERIFRSQAQIDRDKVIAESMRTLQPAFLKPWQPIEELGFEIIAQEKKEAIRGMIEALEHAYALSKRWKGVDAPTVVGHGQLLALRTWTLWGAWALDCENWNVVHELIHRRVNFDTPYGEQSESFAEHTRVHYPDASGPAQGYGNCDLAARSVYNPLDGFMEQRFFNLEERQGFIGLWLFAIDIVHPRAWPKWFLAPKLHINRLLSRLESDSIYAREFAQAVMNTDPATLNQTWKSGLRDQLLDHRRLGSGYHPWVLEDFQLPQRFAE